MKFMLMRKADSETEQGILPTDELFKAMLEYNDRMIQAGVFLFGNGLRPTSEGCRIVFRNGQPEVLPGPSRRPANNSRATPSWRSTASNRPSNGPGNGRRWTVTAMRYWNCGAISNRGISPPVRWWRHTSSS